MNAKTQKQIAALIAKARTSQTVGANATEHTIQCFEHGLLEIMKSNSKFDIHVFNGQVDDAMDRAIDGEVRERRYGIVVPCMGDKAPSYFSGFKRNGDYLIAFHIDSAKTWKNRSTAEKTLAKLRGINDIGFTHGTVIEVRDER